MWGGWIGEHWLDLVQTAGIVGGLLFSGYVLWRDERSRKVSNLIALTEQHRNLWNGFVENPKLLRVLRPNANLENRPISKAEEVFVISLIVHLEAVHAAAKEGLFFPIEGLQRDVGNFFSLPIPAAVWAQNEKMRNADFRVFVQRCLEAAAIAYAETT